MIDALMVVLLIISILALLFIARCLILIFIDDYAMWKREKENKNRYHQVEDKFKNRKLPEPKLKSSLKELNYD